MCENQKVVGPDRAHQDEENEVSFQLLRLTVTEL